MLCYDINNLIIIGTLQEVILSFTQTDWYVDVFLDNLFNNGYHRFVW